MRALAALGGITMADDPRPPPASRTWRVTQDIAYGPHADALVDIYLPRAGASAGLLLFAHGGGWVGGQKKGGGGVGRALAGCGFTVASIEYRKVPQTDVAGQAADLAQAAAFLLAGAGGHLPPASRLALGGHSAGAHLASLVATDPAYGAAAGIAAAAFAAVLAFDGVFDIAAMARRYPHTAPPQVFGTDPEAWARLSPQAMLPLMQADPLFGILHQDTNARFIEQADSFRAALRAAGRRVIHAVAPGLDHMGVMKHFDDTAQPMLGFAAACLRQAFPRTEAEK